MGHAWPVMYVMVEGDLWYLWLVAWLCHPHVCLFTIHHKCNLSRMPTFCFTTPIGWQKDLMTCHHALVGCFVTTFPFPATFVSSSFSNHPFFSCPLHHGRLEIVFRMYLITLTSVSPVFFPIPVVDCLSASILWSLNGTVFIHLYCLCGTIRCVKCMSCYSLSLMWWMNSV